MQRVEARRGAVPKSMQQANTSGGGRCQVCSIILRQRGCTVVAESGREERWSPKVQAAGQHIRRARVGVRSAASHSGRGGAWQLQRVEGKVQAVGQHIRRR